MFKQPAFPAVGESFAKVHGVFAFIQVERQVFTEWHFLLGLSLERPVGGWLQIEKDGKCMDKNHGKILGTP